MEKKPNTPALRFRGSSGEWRKERFDNLVTRISTAEDTPALPRVEYEDIISGQGRLNKNINQKKSLKIGIKFEKGDILYGKLRPYLQNWLYPAFDGIAVGDFWVLRAKNADGKFIYYLIQSDAFQNFTNQTTGTKMPRADWNVVSAAEFVVPHDLLEQKHIGDLAQRLDEKIFLSEEKFKKLRQFRQAMLTKLFPAEGASEPALRFRGFSGEWEILKLKELADIQTGPFGSQLHKEDYVQNGTPIVTVEHLGEKFFTEQNLPRVSDEDKKRLQKYTLHEGDIVFSRVGAIDRSSYVDEIHDGWLFSGRCLRVRPGRKVYPLYLYYYLQLASVKNFIYSIAVGGTMPSLNTLILGQVDIMVPNVVAQKKIGDFFAHLDDILSLQKEKLDKLRLLKAALLDRLFV